MAAKVREGLVSRAREPPAVCASREYTFPDYRAGLVVCRNSQDLRPRRRLHHEERSSSCPAGGGLADDPGSRLPQDCVVQGAVGCRMVGHLVLFILSSKELPSIFRFFCMFNDKACK